MELLKYFNIEILILKDFKVGHLGIWAFGHLGIWEFGYL